MIKNAKSLPKVYFGLHMVEGVAEYREPGQEPYRIMVAENCLKEMDKTFQGRPVYVSHVDEVNLDNLQAEADGYVVRSFFNKADGKHWAEFIVVSDRAHEAINKKWVLSNSYLPKRLDSGGEWHGVEYAKEIVEGEYDHLAIVPDPRYQESIILTPDQFKEYCESKEQELMKIANSKGESKMKLSFFKKTKVENAKEIDLENMSVVLPKSGREITITQLVNEADDMEKKENADMADGEKHVMVGDSKMKVNELLNAYEACKNELEEMKKKNAPVDEVKNEDEAMDNEEDEDDKKENKEDEEAKAKALELAAHEEKEIEEAKKKNAKANFEKLKNAESKSLEVEASVLDLSDVQVARGKSRYGSN